MVKRCKDCPGNETSEVKFTSEVKQENKVNEHEGEKRFSFPKYGVQFYAKNMQEATKKLQAMLSSKEK